MREWWEYNKVPFYVTLFCAVVVLWCVLLVKFQNERALKVYQDCMADVHNVCYCEMYSYRHNKYVP